MKKLLRGIAEFRRTRRAEYAATFAQLALGQQPDALMIACSDSRVAPNVFASTEPGDVFVVRNVGNLVPPFASADVRAAHSVPAAIEFALAALPIRDVVVCGHSECGAMRAIHDDVLPPDAPHLDAWLAHGREVREGLGPPPPGLASHNHLSQRSALRQLDHLRTYPAVRAAEAAGRLRLRAWWFDIAGAEVLDYEPSLDRFVPLDEARVERLLAERR
ncbi:MAG: carbonic anhydrase [Planctomycetes bacterium]|nr:carbonic anhydrase [Planctomycetota bacterium]